MKQIKSEDDILSLINEVFPSSGPSVQLGRGDDCAELFTPDKISLSTDLFLEDIHFRRNYFTLREIGYKALACNISDMAASGSVPTGFSLGLMIPAGFSMEEAKEVFEGMAELSSKYNLVLSGGDLSKNPSGLGFCITIWGEPTILPDDKSATFLRRGVAKPGDNIFLIHPEQLGCLGLAKIGLMLLEEQGRDVLKLYPKAGLAHLKPIPMVHEGIILSQINSQINSMGGNRDAHTIGLMDLSDGLYSDLPRLLRHNGKQFGANINIPPKNLHTELLRFAEKRHSRKAAQSDCKKNPNGSLESIALETALSGGEEYALVGTCPPSLIGTLAEKMPHSCIIGEVTEEPDFLCNGIVWDKLITKSGFDHFSA